MTGMWELEVRPLTVLAAVLAIGAGAFLAGRGTSPGPVFPSQAPTVQYEKVLTPKGMRVLACTQTAVAVSCLDPHGRP
jgi:hypothetical protein